MGDGVGKEGRTKSGSERRESVRVTEVIKILVYILNVLY
jgi:hypothetical protein